jgi:hypothetical protein
VSALGVVALVLGILIIVALVVAVVMVPLARRARRLGAEMETELGPGVRRKANVQGLGLESRGRAQVRGNGWLVLCDDELRFRQWVPDRETRISLSHITAVDTPRWWLGKSVGSRLLCVRWQTPEGAEDGMAWATRDLDAWLEEIAAARGDAS